METMRQPPVSVAWEDLRIKKSNPISFYLSLLNQRTYPWSALCCQSQLFHFFLVAKLRTGSVDAGGEQQETPH